MRTRNLACLFLVGLVLAACIAGPSTLRPSTQDPVATRPTESATITGSVQSVTTRPDPSTVPTFPTFPPQPEITPMTLVPDPPDLSPYLRALKPEFAADVEALPGITGYQIDVTLENATVLRGMEDVHYTNNEDVSLDRIVFRLYPNLLGFGGRMTVEEVLLKDTPIKTSQTTGATALIVPLDPPLLPGESVDLKLRFTARLPTDTSAGYAVFTFADDVYALAGFYPTIPVYDDEGWNVEIGPPYADVTFTDVALYEVYLTVPGDLTVVTSGSVIDTTDNPDGTRTWTAVGGPMRDFYVVMSSDYQVVSRQVQGTRVNSYFRSGDLEFGRRALQYTCEALHLFSRKFGPYPYTELDVVATPTNAGGIEYPGVFVVAQRLYNEDTGDYFEIVVAHETAHQWWYGLVGNDQVDEPWLDEALTNYSVYIYFQATAWASKADEIKRQVFEDVYQTLIDEGRDRGVGGRANDFNAADYSAVVYGKGPLFFDALRTQLGDEAFFAALQNYLDNHRYGIAYPGDLIDAFEKTSNQNVDELYRFWILGQP